jgi:hypothetical protein
MLPQVWVIEFRECGVWTTLDEADTAETAILFASHYVDLHGEENIRISTPDNRIL